MLENLKSRARALKNEVFAVYLAAKDPRTPWYAQAVGLLTVAYALSPIDLIPDFIPILGYLDDLIIVPGGLWLAVKLIPAEVLEESRKTASTRSFDRRVGYVGMAIIVLVWIVVLTGIIYLIIKARRLS
jgi:uncharacterized membrane protein YkvA (DUF1232 family)